MSVYHIIKKIGKLLRKKPLNAICSASAIYLTIQNDTLGSYDEVRNLVDRAVNIALEKITDPERIMTVTGILPQV